MVGKYSFIAESSVQLSAFSAWAHFGIWQQERFEVDNCTLIRSSLWQLYCIWMLELDLKVDLNNNHACCIWIFKTLCWQKDTEDYTSVQALIILSDAHSLSVCKILNASQTALKIMLWMYSLLINHYFNHSFLFAPPGRETEPCSWLCLCCLSGEEAAQGEGVRRDGLLWCHSHFICTWGLLPS